MLLDTLAGAAKANLVKDGSLAPVFFLCCGEQLIMPPTLMSLFDKLLGHIPDADEAKTRDVFLIGGMARKLGADRIIMIWDAAFREYSAASKEELEGDQTERPLLYPKSMRTECIIVNEVLLPSGEDRTLVFPYKGGDGAPVEFLHSDLLSKADSYESRFTEVILKGYNKAGGIAL